MSTWIAPGEIVDGTHFKISGPSESDETICLIHGVGAFHSCFDPLASHLSTNGYKVIQYDLIGRGFSTNHSTELFGVDAHIDQLYHLLNDTLKIDQPIHILGHSMGGALATLFTCKYPTKVKTLTLFAPAGLMNSGPLPVIRSVGCIRAIVKNMLGKKKNAQDAWRKDFHNHKGVFLEREELSVQRMTEQFDNNPQWFNAFFQTVLQFPLYGLEAQVKTLSEMDDLPIHLVWGKNDPTVPFKPDYTRWKTALESGKCRFSTFVIDKAAHAFFLEHPDETNSDVLAFLQTVKASAQDGQI